MNRWTIEEALELIQRIQPSVRKFDYHCLLGGGVLNKGFSEKDLDLFFVPLNGYNGQKDNLWSWLNQNLGGTYLTAIRDSPRL